MSRSCFGSSESAVHITFVVAMALSRTKNDATEEDLGKAIRANLSCFNKAEWAAVTDPEELCVKYVALMEDILCVTSRPVRSLRRKALKPAWEPYADQGEQAFFADKVSAIMHHIQTKHQSTKNSSGKKAGQSL